MSLPGPLRSLGSERWSADVPLRPEEFRQRFNAKVGSADGISLRNPPKPGSAYGRYTSDGNSEHDEFELFLWGFRGPLVLGKGRVRASMTGTRLELDTRLNPLTRFALWALTLMMAGALTWVVHLTGDFRVLGFMVMIVVLVAAVAFEASNARAKLLGFTKELCGHERSTLDGVDRN